MKKLLLIALVLIINQSTAQNCESIFMKKVDKIAGTSNYELKKLFPLKSTKGKSAALQVYVPSEKLIYLSFIFTSNFCVNEDAECAVLLKNGTRLKIYTFGKFNCQGKFHFSFGGYRVDIEDMSKIGIESIRLVSATDHYDFNLTAQQTESLKKTLGCAFTLSSNFK